MTDDLISRKAALDACQKTADEAKGYGIPQMVMGAHTCRDAIRALPAAQVGAKPLEWHKDSRPSAVPQRYLAVLPGGMGDYSVSGSECQNQWQWFRNGYFVDGHRHHNMMLLKDAQAAAQADYDARILAALTLTPTTVATNPAPDTSDKLREAVDACAKVRVAAPSEAPGLLDYYTFKRGWDAGISAKNAAIRAGAKR